MLLAQRPVLNPAEGASTYLGLTSHLSGAQLLTGQHRPPGE